MNSKNFHKLLEKDLVVLNEYESIEQVFNEIGAYLEKKDYVTDEYVLNLTIREENHPTGIDLSVIGTDMPNIAIPHTESKYCKVNKIMVVKLTKELLFKDMIDPLKDIKVKYLFMILNAEGSEQSTVLSDIMEYVSNPENIKNIEKANTVEQLYQALLQEEN